jgi:hypothetical protein
MQCIATCSAGRVISDVSRKRAFERKESSLDEPVLPAPRRRHTDCSSETDWSSPALPPELASLLRRLCSPHPSSDAFAISLPRLTRSVPTPTTPSTCCASSGRRDQTHPFSRKVSAAFRAEPARSRLYRFTRELRHEWNTPMTAQPIDPAAITLPPSQSIDITTYLSNVDDKSAT